MGSPFPNGRTSTAHVQYEGAFYWLIFDNSFINLLN